MKRRTEIIENILIIIFILLLLPFPKIIEEILIGILFCICFFFCFLGNIKKGESFNMIYAYNLPYLIIVTMLLQIHSTRFSLVANNMQNQLLCVRLYQWVTEILHFTDTINFGILIYFWFLIYFLFFIFSNGAKQQNPQEEKTEISEDCNFILEKISKYTITCFVICFFHFVCEIIKDMIVLKSNFETAFLSNIVITIGNCIPFVIIYLMMACFVYKRRNLIICL